MSKKWIYFSSLFCSYMVFGSVAISVRCVFLKGIECFLLRKNISNFTEATREKRFTTMTPLGTSRDVTCHRLWRHNGFSNIIQFVLIYFISIWTSQNLLKIRPFLCIRKRNELFDHPSNMFIGLPVATRHRDVIWLKKCWHDVKTRTNNNSNICNSAWSVRTHTAMSLA